MAYLDTGAEDDLNHIIFSAPPFFYLSSGIKPLRFQKSFRIAIGHRLLRRPGSFLPMNKIKNDEKRNRIDYVLARLVMATADAVALKGVSAVFESMR